MQEEHHLLRLPEDDTCIEDLASPNTIATDPLPPGSDVENHQGTTTTTFLNDDALDTDDPRIPSDHESEPDRFFQRCGVWPANGAPAFHPTMDEIGAGRLADNINSDDDGHCDNEDLREFDDDNGDDDLDVLTDEELASQPQGMSALDELELDFEHGVAASGMYIRRWLINE
jgi:hypothetical protein